MPIPMYSPEQLEKAALILHGAPLMIMGDQQGTASAANPAGLRVAGGNLFRDYTPWTEQEIIDFSMGMGHNKIGDNGFLVSHAADTIHDSLRLQPQLDTLQSFLDVDISARGWTTDPLWESRMVAASDGSLYAFAGYKIFKYDDTAATWSLWFNIVGTIFTSAGVGVDGSYIIDMCEHAGYLCIITKPVFRATEPTVGAGQYKAQATLIQEFRMYTQNSAGGVPELLGFHPNVWFIDLIDKKVGGIDNEPATLPLATPSATYTVADKTNGSRYQALVSTMCATACASYGGYLFVGGSAGFAYSGGGAANFGEFTPNGWTWDGMLQTAWAYYPGANEVIYQRLQSPLNLSTKWGGERWVTGFAGIQGQSVGDFAVYMSTSDALYLLDLAIPVAVKVMEYTGKNVRNGRGMIAYNNDLYIPTNKGIIRFTATGQVVQVGFNTVPDMPADMFTYHVQLAASPNMLISSTMPRGSGMTTARIMGLKGQGWHDLMTITSTAYANAIHYRAKTNTVHMIALGFKVSGAGPDATFRKFTHLDSATDIDDSATAYPYTASIASVYLGVFDAGAPLLEKDWHSVSIFGSCFGANTTVDVQYKISNLLDECGWQVPWTTSGWTSLGIVNTNVSSQEFILPNLADCAPTRAGKYLQIRLVLSRNVLSTYLYDSPVVTAVKLKYFVPIDDYFRFSYNLILPRDCLTDICGEEFAGYVQEDWSDVIKAAVCSVEPVRFRDIDGIWYQVRIESASRRIDNVKYVSSPSPHREYAETWSLVMVQLKSVTICAPDWLPAVCP